MTSETIPSKRELIEKYGLHQAEIARLRKTTRSAVAQWDMEAPIPERRWLILRYQSRPDLFSQPPSGAAA